MLITTVATLAIAAIALLGPLENSLRKADATGAQKRSRTDVAKRFERLPLGDLDRVRQQGPTSAGRGRSSSCRTETGGAVVAVLGDAGLRRIATPDVLIPGAANPGDSYTDVALRARSQPAATTASSRSTATEYASAVIPFKVRELIVPPPARPPKSADARPGRGARRDPADHACPPAADWWSTHSYVIVLRKSVAEIPAVVHVVTPRVPGGRGRRAGADADARVGLSGRLVRAAAAAAAVAIAVEQDGPASVVPVDRARDEVGDLARTLAAMQERLRQQEEARRAFVATASHELRTPLTSLDGMLELLHDDLEYDGSGHRRRAGALARARAQSRRLGRLAADLLDLSRMDAQVELRSEPVELWRDQPCRAGRVRAGCRRSGGIRLSLELRGESAWALGDPGVDRPDPADPGRQRGPDQPPRIRDPGALRRGRVVTLSVCDEGPGVREEERDAIFQRFKRGRDTARPGGVRAGAGDRP